HRAEVPLLRNVVRDRQSADRLGPQARRRARRTGAGSEERGRRAVRRERAGMSGASGDDRLGNRDRAAAGPAPQGWPALHGPVIFRARVVGCILVFDSGLHRPALYRLRRRTMLSGPDPPLRITDEDLTRVAAGLSFAIAFDTLLSLDPPVLKLGA